MGKLGIVGALALCACGEAFTSRQAEGLVAGAGDAGTPSVVVEAGSGGASPAVGGEGGTRVKAGAAGREQVVGEAGETGGTGADGAAESGSSGETASGEGGSLEGVSGAPNSAGAGGEAAPECTPLAPERACLGRVCGDAPTGCGAQVNCGACPGPRDVCLDNGQCECTPQGIDVVCAGRCGSASDGCSPDAYDCGGCDSVHQCSVAGLCALRPECDCAEQGFKCGKLPQCATSVFCGPRGDGRCATDGAVCVVTADEGRACSDTAISCKPDPNDSSVGSVYCAAQTRPECRVAYVGCGSIQIIATGEWCPLNNQWSCGPGY